EQAGQNAHSWLLTVKMTGRTKAPDWRRGCKLSSGTRGDATGPHGTLQRLLDVICPSSPTAVFLQLHRRTIDASKGTKHAAIARHWPKQFTTTFALVEVDARI